MISYGIMAKQDIFWNLMVLVIHEPLLSDPVYAMGGNETVPASKIQRILFFKHTLPTKCGL